MESEHFKHIEHFGEKLREARQKAGRSLEDISRRTKIPTPALERIERGDEAALPANVFVCGFLRAYARELGVDGDAAVARFLRVRKAPGMNAAPELASVEPSSHRDETSPRLPLGRTANAAGPDAAAVAIERGATELSATDRGGLFESMMARIPGVESALGRGPTFALVVLLVVLVATITLSLLLGGDPSPGRGLS